MPQNETKERTMMNDKHIDTKRRRVLLGAIAAVAGMPLIRETLGTRAEAAELPHLSEDDTNAKALHYHTDATKAPRIDLPNSAAEDQFCNNCQNIMSDNGEWRPCRLFPGKAVNANGWCAGWTKKTG